MDEKDLIDAILILRSTGLKNVYTQCKLELSIMWLVKILTYSHWKWGNKDPQLVAKELVII